ncbi:Ribonuclease MRP protein subunit rmp1 [Sporothrix eucalyptigena]
MATIRIPPAKAPTTTSAPLSTPQPPSLPSAAERYAAAAERLDDTNILLHGLYRRHKNQHRVSTYWWPAFGQLRRHVRRLEAEVHAVHAPENVEDDRVKLAIAHARDMRDHFVPKAYLAFSRLVADRRHAQLGLLLMGVLAQVHTALRQIMGDTATKKEGADGEDENEDDEEGTHKATDGLLIAPIEEEDDNDLGEVIARENTDEEDLDKREKAKKVEEKTPAKPVIPSALPTKKRSWPDVSDDSDTDDNLASLEPRAKFASAKADEEPKTRPEMKKKTEESSVISKAKEASEVREKDKKKEKRDKKDKEKDKAKKAKKRKKNGDEFDDLFSGLL